MQENLGDYGHGFQVKVLASLLSDKGFAARIIEILDPEYFDAPQLKWLAKVIITFFVERKEMPTLDVLKVELINTVPKENELLRKEIVNALRLVFESIGSIDIEYIKEKTSIFCRQQNAKKVILECVDCIKNEKFDEIISKMEDAVRIGNDYTLGHIYSEGVDERYKEENLERISTGWQVLDDLTGGGIPKGKLATVMAPLGAGKTFCAVALAANAIKDGKTVLFCTLELSELEIGRRFDSALSGLPLDNIPMHLSTLKQQLNKLTGKLFIKEFLSGVGLIGIEAYIDQCKLLGINPDVIVIDYDELIDLHYDKSLRYDQQMQFLYRDLRRRIAIGKNTVLWLLAQSSKEGAEDDIVRMTHSANSYGKNREVDFTLTLSRKDKDKVSNTARFQIGKSRLGPDGITLPAHFNPNLAQIKIFHPDSHGGKEQNDKMINDNDYLKQLANNYYQDLKINNTRTEKNDLF